MGVGWGHCWGQDRLLIAREHVGWYQGTVLPGREQVGVPSKAYWLWQGQVRSAIGSYPAHGGGWIGWTIRGYISRGG